MVDCQGDQARGARGPVARPRTGPGQSSRRSGNPVAARRFCCCRQSCELPLGSLITCNGNWAMPQEQAGRGVATGRPFARHLGLLGATLLLPMLALEAFLLIRIAASERARHEQEARDAAHHTALVADK